MVTESASGSAFTDDELRQYVIGQSSSELTKRMFLESEANPEDGQVATYLRQVSEDSRRAFDLDWGKLASGAASENSGGHGSDETPETGRTTGGELTEEELWQYATNNVEDPALLQRMDDEFEAHRPKEISDGILVSKASC